MGSDRSNPDMGDFISAVLGGLMGFAIGMSVAFYAIGPSFALQQEVRYQRQAIDRGVAEYDATTGEWKWTVQLKVKAEKEARDG